MKKSKINPEEMLKDLTNALNLVNQLETLNLEKDSLNNLTKDLENMEKNLESKYKKIIKEESENNLDSEE
tara:strand:- start:61 stop:270 length:210 start_codon:yes stop_codon:yes gene_type:complete